MPLVFAQAQLEAGAALKAAQTTKEEARHSAEMQELLARTPESADSEAGVSDAELDEALKEVA